MVSLPLLLNRISQRYGEAHTGNQMCQLNTDTPPTTELHFPPSVCKTFPFILHTYACIRYYIHIYKK